jgi:hypothetical protein
MILHIDSETVELPREANETFRNYCKKLMDWLLERNKSISSIRFDGKLTNSDQESVDLFPSVKLLEVNTTSVQVALQSAIALQCNVLRKLENDCQNLVTDCLLAEATQIAETWEGMCREIKAVLSFLPCLNALLTEEQVDFLVDTKLQEVQELMKEMHEILNSADVVKMSDVLELKLAPWLVSLREFFQAQLSVIETLSDPAAK